ncbi:ComF family protein [Endozoicomonas sp. YOMI1]|uniref:ComF family protein n=1 Tax=Endozoicomonas sp. YOMI1 TaxID=2828739 RepID=UPI002148436C|nr:hypothetical protein [Endozoicomonas sp. YOMI1]
MSYEIHGNWKAGWAIDLHTVSSIPLPDGGFDTTYTDTGKALNQLKYHSDYSQIEPLAKTAVEFLRTRVVTPYLNAIISVPPSFSRELQPVQEIAKKISEALGIPHDLDYLIKTRPTDQLKGVTDQAEREKIIAGAFKVDDLRYKNGKILLFDDLFRSGTTLNEITKVLYNEGQVQNVYVVTLTKTRVNR